MKDGYKIEKNVKEWKRCSEAFENVVVFNESISERDIKQQSLGDCYFLSNLSALSKVPANIHKMFITQKINKAGIYLLSYYQNGIEYPVILDDFIPIHPYKMPAFGITVDKK